MLIETKRPDWTEGVWYYLDHEDTHDLLAVLAGDSASDEERVLTRKKLEGRAMVRIVPMTNAEYAKARNGSTILQTAFDVKSKGGRRGGGTMVMKSDPVERERAFARELVVNNVKEVRGITARCGPSGDVEEVTDIKHLLRVVDASSSEAADGLIDEIHDAIRSSENLGHGLGEA